MQTKFGNKEGNCLNACLASLMEFPLDKIPDFMKDDNPFWQDELNKWLSQFNLWLFNFYWNPEKSNWTSGNLTHAYCIGSGPSPRSDCWHSVICRIKINEGKMEIEWEHDPHPSGDMLKKLVEIGFLIPRDPGSLNVKS